MSSLPKYFPADKLKSLQLSKVNWFYSRYVEEHYQYYTFGHFIMAAYAAVPALLTPDLLYKIWLNFNQYQWRNKPLNIHRIAVSDVLLAPFCREVGFELYEMDDAVRNAFLEWLELASKSEIWTKRQLQTPHTIAQFLQEYQRLSNPGTIRWGKGYDEAQTWNNWLIINPERSQEMLLQKVKKATEEKDELGMLRAMDFWAKAKGRVEVLFSHDKDLPQWTDFKQNATFAAALKAQIQGNSGQFSQIIQDNPALKAFLSRESAGGFEVKLSKEAQEQVAAIRPPTIFAAVIGINNYTNATISSLEGCVNDAKAFAITLADYCEQEDKPLDSITLIDEEATYQAIEEMIVHFRQARNGDVCVLYFAGHTRYLDLAEHKGRRFILHDSDTEEKEISQYQLEEWLYPLLIEKEVPFLMVVDSHEAKEEFKKDLSKNALRKNAQKLKGSLVILNAGRPGELTFERDFEGKKRGVFTYNLEKALKEGGFKNNYSQLMELARVRMLQNQDQQTPFLEAIPNFSAHNLFLTNITDAKMTFQVNWFEEEKEWRINGGKKQGITPSLDFMLTELELKDGTKVRVREVYEDYAVLEDFEADIEQEYEAVLLQKALPKIKVAFDVSLDKGLKVSIESAIQEYNIYYIDLVDEHRQAQYFIRNRGDECYLSRKPRQFQKADNPVFKFESSPFELIKQMEYIAQWAGILEFNRNSSFIKRKDVEIRLEALEGIPNSELYTAKPTATYTGSDLDLVQLNYKKTSQDWQPPAFRCGVKNHTNKPLFINALYLDSQYGILDFGSYELSGQGAPSRDAVFRWVPLFTYLEIYGYKTMELNIDDAYLKAGKTEIIDYVKLFISDKPMHTEPVHQESLALENQVIKRSGSGAFRARTFDATGIDWTAITIPIKITKQEEEAKKQEEELWEYASSEKTFDAYEGYLKIFPNGRWAEIGREKLEEILNQEMLIYNNAIEETSQKKTKTVDAKDTLVVTDYEFTNIREFKQVIKKIISRNKIKEALDLINQILINSSIFENKLFVLFATYQMVDMEYNIKGVISYEDYVFESGNIVTELLNFIDDLEEKDINVSDSPQISEVNEKKSNDEIKEFKSYLIELTTKGELKNAISLLTREMKPNDNLANQLVVLSSKNKNIEEHFYTGRLVYNDYVTGKKTIYSNFFTIVSNLENNDILRLGNIETLMESSVSSTNLSKLEQEGLIEQAELLTKRINLIRRALAIETDPNRQFKYEEEIKELEQKLAEIKEKLS